MELKSLADIHKAIQEQREFNIKYNNSKCSLIVKENCLFIHLNNKDFIKEIIIEMVKKNLSSDTIQERLQAHILVNYGTLANFAESSSLDNGNLHRILNGNPTLKTLREIAKLCNFKEKF